MERLVSLFSKLPQHELEKLHQFVGRVIFNKLPRSEQVRVHWRDGRGRKRHTSPWAPSEGDIELYEKNIDSLSQTPGRALVLGSTPGLRDLLFLKKIPYIVVDQSFRRLHTSMLKHADRETETWIRGNWATLDFPEGHFDLIVGDLVLWQFLTVEQNAFLSHLSFLLSDQGSFVSRIHAQNSSLVHKDPAEIISETIALHEDSNITSNVLMARLMDRCAEGLKTGRVQALRAIEKYLEDKGDEKNILREALKDWEAGYLDYAMQGESEILGTLNSHFRISSKECAQDYYDSEFYPVVTCSRK